MSDGVGPDFPPLLTGVAVAEGRDPFAQAVKTAAGGCDAGTVLHHAGADRLRAAVILAPEVPLRDAVAMQIAGGIGAASAIGALGPPEVAVQLEWAGTLRVNGGRCGRLRMAAADGDPLAVPDWLVLGFEMQMIPPHADAPGLTPEDTSLFDEGCADITPTRLLESWTRHLLVWIHNWSEAGNAPLHAEWRGLAWGIGEEIAHPLDVRGACGTFRGMDERFGMLFRQGGETLLIPLTALLERNARS